MTSESDAHVSHSSRGNVFVFFTFALNLVLTPCVAGRAETGAGLGVRDYCSSAAFSRVFDAHAAPVLSGYVCFRLRLVLVVCLLPFGQLVVIFVFLF